MRWRQMAAVVLSVMAMTGCPFEFGKSGRVGKAVHKDTEEHLLYITSCSEARKRDVCEGPLRDPVECEKCQ
jgi:hypothetical protein